MEDRNMAWEVTAGGARYTCDRCSWVITFDRERYSEAHQEFYKHTRADYPPAKTPPKPK
jgi:hypothetical protein